MNTATQRRLPDSSARDGFSLLEVTAVAIILAIVTALAVAVSWRGVADSKAAACGVNVGDVELQAELWLQRTGSWPANDLSNIGVDLEYFPSGLPICPVDGSAYQLDGSGRVVGHSH